MVVMHGPPCNGQKGKTMRAGFNHVFALTDEIVEMVVGYTEVRLALWSAVVRCVPLLCCSLARSFLSSSLCQRS